MDVATQSVERHPVDESLGSGSSAEVLVFPLRTAPAPYAAAQVIDRAAKRALDIAVAGVLLLALLPVILIACLLIVLDSPGGPFFRCERAGHRGSRLRMLKFRKMRADAGGRALTTDDDDRFTRASGWPSSSSMRSRSCGTSCAER